MKTGLVWDERYMWWDTRHGAAFMPAGGWVEPGEHAENPSTKRRFKNLIDVSGMGDVLVPLKPRMATIEEVQRYHTPEYVSRMKELSDAGGGDAGELTPFGAGGFETALLAVGGTLTAIEKTLDGTVETAYALVRPPGHHAQKDIGRGFCMFSNAALGAMHARQALGLDRVAVVDWDVHHGNGTQWAFYDDPGLVEHNGEGDGVGANLNIPLPPGGGRAAYDHAFEHVVLPALERFQPELLLVASGLDASMYDPNARMNLSADCFGRYARMLIDAADRLCGGRVLFIHEGGYSSMYVPYCGLRIVEELTGERTGVPDALNDGDPTQHPLHDHERAAVAAAAANVERVPTP